MASSGSVDRDWAEAYPDMLTYAFKFELGPGSNGKIRARFIGDDPEVLRKLGDQAMAIIAEDPNSRAIKNDWRNRVKVFRPVIAEEAASRAGIQPWRRRLRRARSVRGPDSRGISRRRSVASDYCARPSQRGRGRGAFDEPANLESGG